MSNLYRMCLPSYIAPYRIYSYRSDRTAVLCPYATSDFRDTHSVIPVVIPTLVVTAKRWSYNRLRVLLRHMLMLHIEDETDAAHNTRSSHSRLRTRSCCMQKTKSMRPIMSFTPNRARPLQAPATLTILPH